MWLYLYKEFTNEFSLLLNLFEIFHVKNWGGEGISKTTSRTQIIKRSPQYSKFLPSDTLCNI